MASSGGQQSAFSASDILLPAKVPACDGINIRPTRHNPGQQPGTTAIILRKRGKYVHGGRAQSQSPLR
jgi:hypothetical protein